VSGSTIGGIAGAVIGAYFGGPQGAQWGYAIGSVVGGALDPQHLQGPRLGELPVQTAYEGAPRPIPYGSPEPFAGNLMMSGDHVRVTVEEQQGKGGPVIETEKVFMTYAIRICEARVPITVVQVWRNEKLVYDRTGRGIIDADSAMFWSRAVFYDGNEEQLPDATLESLPRSRGGGVGNVPAHHGTAYMVVVNDDLTDLRGAIPNYKFRVTTQGTGTAEASYKPLLFGGSPYPFLTSARGSRDPRKPDVTYQYTTRSPDVWRDTPEEALADLAEDIASEGKTIQNPQLMGWSPDSFEVDTTGIGFWPDAHMAPWDGAATPEPIQMVVALAYSRRSFARVGPDDGQFISATGFGYPYQACASIPEPTWCRVTRDFNTRFQSGVVVVASADPGGSDGNLTCGSSTGSGVEGGTYYWFGDAVVRCRAVPDCAGAPEYYYEAPDAPGFSVGAVFGDIIGATACEPVSGSFKQLSLLSYETLALGSPLVSFPVGPTMDSTDDDYNNEALWTSEYLNAVAQGLMPPGMTYSASGGDGAGTYPRITTDACRCLPTLPPIEEGSIYLSEIELDIGKRCRIEESQFDVAADTEVQVLGYLIPRQMTGRAALQPLGIAFFRDYPEYDLKIHSVPRGLPSVGTITRDDWLIGKEEDKETRGQLTELPRRTNLFYSSRAANYTRIMVSDERESRDIPGRSVVPYELPLVLDDDDAKQKVEILQKVMYEEAQGTLQIELPFYRFAYLVPSDCFDDEEGKRWRIDRQEITGNVQKLEVKRDRVSNYESDATADVPIDPTLPVSNLKGPTLLQALNLPRLRSQDTSSGMYLAATGLTPAWPGADIYLSVDGGVTENLVGRITRRAAMGRIAETTDINSSGEPIVVTMFDNRDLSTVTGDQIAAGANAFAITSDGVSEIGQFQTPLETSSGDWELFDVVRGANGTDRAQHLFGAQFLMLDRALLFVRVDASYAGRTLIWRAVTRGTPRENNPTISVVFNPIFTGSEEITYYVDENEAYYVDDNGARYEGV